ncbi:isoleucine--tRNA ligase [Patescibacteria group bacterium]|nr:isoleucine--tRNA ligase [Patescibacteria group bacterium]
MSNEHRSAHAKQEHEVLDYWDEYKCFEKSVAQRPAGKPYVFYDGPPFATGLPHYGHLVVSVIKDVVARYWTMQGYRVERTWGWDCHGLPIENIVEKKFDLNTRKDIEKFGIEAFNNQCHEEVLTYAEDWKKVIRRLARWVDMENAYKTMDMPFMESVWWVFKQLWDEGLIYEGHLPMHICPRCETVLSNFEVNLGYADVTDLSVYVTFKLLSGPQEGAHLIAWTTTPWTLPGNTLIAVKPDLDYSIVEHDSQRYVVAEKLLEQVFEGKEYKEIEKIKGSDIDGSTYEPLFPFFKTHDNAFRVVGADFVTTEEGTGLVHIAPGFGEDDKLLGERENVAPIMHVKMNGHFVEEVVKPLAAEGYKVEDVPVKAKGDTQSVDIELIKWLAHQGKLFRKEKITHSYPHCWRCDTPLLNYSTSSWFVRVTELRDRLVATNKEINWVPENIKEGRFGKWLESARDWAVSRSRYWGTPLPVWKSEDGDVICVGSVKELKTWSGKKKIDNLHKHIIDKIEIEKDGKIYKHVPEVLDCWFESGSMPYAQIHYPFENEQKFDQGFPAEFIAEAQDQTRGWFYTLHVLSNALFNMPAFKNVIVNGIVLAEDGKKMSKRLKNYPDPVEVMEKYGADSMRYYLMSSPVVRADNLRFSEREVAEVAKKLINILLNVSEFYKLYKEYDDGRTPSGEHVLDRWIFSRLNQTLEVETSAMGAYDLQAAARPLQSLVTDLSTWYVRRSRDRMKVEGEDRLEALATLRTVLEIFSKMLAPFMPFLAEIIYQDLKGGFLGKKKRLSVHLEDWPDAGEFDQEVLDEMGKARAIVSRALDIREEAGRPVKQVLASMKVSVPSGKIADEYLQVIKDEVNVKAASVEKGDLKVELDLELTPELIREGMARDIVRRVNQLRKEAGLTINDRILLKVWSPSDEVEKMFDEHSEAIRGGALADLAEFRKDEEVEHQAEFRVAEQDVWIGF